MRMLLSLDISSSLFSCKILLMSSNTIVSVPSWSMSSARLRATIIPSTNCCRCSTLGCRSREDPFLEKESLKRVSLIQRRCQKPAQEPELPFRVQILNNVGPMKLNSISCFVGMESFLYLEALLGAWLWNFATVSSATCDSKKLTEQRFDIGCTRVTGQDLVDVK